MFFSLVQVSLLVPLLLVFGLSYLCRPVLNRNVFVGLIAVIVWLSIYLWIVTINSIMPRQALDWIWVYLLISGWLLFANQYLNILSKHVVLMHGVVFSTIAMLMVWPVMAYEASFFSGFQIKLEVFVFIVAGIYALKNIITASGYVNSHTVIMAGGFYLWLISGALGIVVIITGSLLVGMLLVTLSSVNFAMALYCRYLKCVDNKIISQGLCLLYGLLLLLLLIARIYADMALMISVLFLLTIVFSSESLSKYMHYRMRYIFFMLLGAAVFTSIYSEFIANTASAYYSI